MREEKKRNKQADNSFNSFKNQIFRSLKHKGLLEIAERLVVKDVKLKWVLSTAGKNFLLLPPQPQITKVTEETVKSTCPTGHLLTEFRVTSFLQLHEIPLFRNTLSGSFSESRQPWLIPSGEIVIPLKTYKNTFLLC